MSPELLTMFSTDQLIRELKRRGRLRTIGKTTAFFNELMEDDRYMDSMNLDLVRSLGIKLDNGLCIRYRDRVLSRDPHYNRPRTTARYASIVVLVPEDVVNETVQGMRGASEANQRDVRDDQTMGEKPDATGQSDIADAQRESSNSDSPE